MRDRELVLMISMLRTGVCDNEVAFGCQLETYPDEYAAKEDIEIEVDVLQVLAALLNS